ncbi:MAG: hypothetical protein LBP93_08855 [Treponema sp.]|jgi:hypothetical protein|nr:hypothetical protein [Treponema sp.]
MASRIIRLSVEDAPVLGFDTGVNAAAFTQAKLAQLIGLAGTIVGPDGTIQAWKSEGVVEREGTMVIWGPPFTGERLDLLLADDTQADRALRALRYWIRARLVLGGEAPPPWPAGALLQDADPEEAPREPGTFPAGTILFPPERLLRRAVEAEGPGAWLGGAERWVHPDLTGDGGAVFAAGTMLYRIFCGVHPFPQEDPDILRQDIREGVFLPPRLAAPDLKEDLASLIHSALMPPDKKDLSSRKQAKPPGLEALGSFLGPPDSGDRASFFQTPDGESLKKIELERERFSRKQAGRVKTRRFLRRNTAILSGVVIGLVVLGLIIQSILAGQARRPSTRGMPALAVVETYYGALGALDHELMEACVVDGAGKSDIDTVINLFVISRVREAYEMANPIIPAQEWVDSGGGPTEGTVFGVSGLRIEPVDRDESDGELSFSAFYTRWLPDSSEPSTTAGGGDPPGPALPRGEALRDDLRLVRRKDAWRIAGIERQEESVE